MVNESQGDVANGAADGATTNSTDVQEPRDWLLSQFVIWANNNNVRTHITLNISGMIVSGTIIGGREYFERVAEQYSMQFLEKDRENVKQIIAGAAEMYPKFESETGKVTPGAHTKDVPPSYIHMQDAKIWSNSGPSLPSQDGVLWRGKIAAVDAFWIGLLSNSQ